MDAVIASTWNLLGILWRVVLVAAPVAFIVWAVLTGRRMDPNALEKGKLDAEAHSDPSVNLVGRGTPPPGF